MTEEIVTYEEVWRCPLSRHVPAKVAALVSLERAVRPEGPGQEDTDAELDRILGKE